MTDNTTRRSGFHFCLVNIDCLPGSSNFNVLMDLEEPVAELLPYLAAVLPGCTYIHGTGVINLMDRGHIIAIYPDRLTITDVASKEEAEAVCATYFDKIEWTRARIGTIEPAFEKRPALSVLDILRQLPKTNCGQCGSTTCMAFAARVFRREEKIFSCTPLRQEETKCEKLLEQLRIDGYQT